VKWEKESLFNALRKTKEQFKRIFRVFGHAYLKFDDDDCFTRASSIAYTTLISLIPTLMVVFTFFSLFSGVSNQKEMIFNEIVRFLNENDIQLNIQPILEVISALVENAGKIGGIGIVVVIFSATAILKTLDKSLNDIWGVEKKRPLYLQFIYYWAALTLGPVVLIAGSTIVPKIFNLISSPDYHGGALTDGRVWVVGSRGVIRYGGDDLKIKDYPVERIFTQETGRQKPLSKFKSAEMEEKSVFFSDIALKAKTGWIVSGSGLILKKDQNEWEVIFETDIKLNKAEIVDKNTAVMAGENGHILRTSDGGKSWVKKQVSNLNADLYDISFFEKRGIAAGDRGYYIVSRDGGNTWDLRRLSGNDFYGPIPAVYAVQRIGENWIWFGGERGLLRLSTDGGNTFQNRSFNRENIRALQFSSKTEGWIGSEKGKLYKTTDGGKNWKEVFAVRGVIREILISGNRIWLLGDSGVFMLSRDGGKNWEGKEGESRFVYIINFLAPFFFAWLLFLLIYLSFPNRRIPFKPAAAGAAITGTLWILFFWLFMIYIRSFAKGTMLIYGALAAIPLFLLLVYSSSLILLYGAEFSYVMLYPEMKLRRRKTPTKLPLADGLYILKKIYSKFESGRGETSLREILKELSYQYSMVHYFIEIFKKEGWIMEADNQRYVPKNASRNLLLSNIFHVLYGADFCLPPQFS
jgi:membrane protein